MRPRGLPRAHLDQAGSRLMANGHQEPLRILDISESGARLELATAQHEGEVVKLSWIPVPGLPPLEIEARLIWRRKYLCGVHFGELSERARTVIRELVKYHREAA